MMISQDPYQLPSSSPYFTYPPFPMPSSPVTLADVEMERDRLFAERKRLVETNKKDLEESSAFKDAEEWVKKRHSDKIYSAS